MPLTVKGKKILAAMTEEYGSEEKAKEVFYASANAGTIEGVHGRDAVGDADGHAWSRRVALGDVALVDAVHTTPDGYLACEARVAKVGVQKYRGSEVGRKDLHDVYLYRPEEEVFSRDAMHSMAHKPVTFTHPKRMVDKQTWTKVARGFSSSPIVRDGEFVRVPLMLTDAAAIDAYNNGVRELSVGYLTDIDWTEGETPEGQHYDGVQRAIHCNHHALVPVARGGSHLRFGDAESQCWNCGARLVGHQDTCPQCGYDLNPVPNAEGAAEDNEAYLKGARDMNGDDDETGDGENGDGKRKGKRPFKGAAPPFTGDGTYSADGGPWKPYWIVDREFTEERRKELAKSGAAKPDGSYPIVTVKDLKNAIRAWGRGGATASDKAHIIKRARALGATSELPEDWQSGSSAKDHGVRIGGGSDMPVIETLDGVPVEFANDHSASYVRQLVAKLNKRIRDQDREKEEEDDEEAEREQDREKKERGYKDAINAKDGQIALLTKQLNDAKAVDVHGAAMERLALVDAAKPYLPDGFPIERANNADIKRAAVAMAMGGETAVKDWDESRVAGAFELLAVGAAKPTGVRALTDGLSHGMARTEGYFGPGVRQLNDAEKARDEYITRTTNAYKTPVTSQRN